MTDAWTITVRASGSDFYRARSALDNAVRTILEHCPTFADIKALKPPTCVEITDGKPWAIWSVMAEAPIEGQILALRAEADRLEQSIKGGRP